MTLHTLIFSDERHHRISRHILFWVGWWLFVSCTWLRNVSPEDEGVGMRNFIIYQFAVTSTRIISQMIFCYSFIYYLVPRFFLKKSYLDFVIQLLLFILFMWLVNYIQNTTTSTFARGLAGLKGVTPFQQRYYLFYSNINFTGTLVSCTLILIFKYYKIWYKKQRENEMLLLENAQSEIQLLKAQVHPHFLFNTLNNIYALSLNNSPKAAAVVQKLSGMINYMNIEGAQSFVTVNKEIKMLLDYIGLEKIRYGDRLEMQLDIQLNQDEHKLIAPLLLIPFVENCFKHGASKQMDKVWLKIKIETNNNYLNVFISNSKPSCQDGNDNRKKIGLVNVKKRLQLIYPGKHSLMINQREDSFTVGMKIELLEQNPTKEDQKIKSTINERFAYVS